ncbi:MAG: hypothetical protein RSB55_08295 [Oscillospiraceae bacterium]
MKQVLWVSRHEMTAPQFADLERVMGEKTKLIPWRETVTEVEVLRSALRRVDAAAVVLPPELLAKLFPLAEGKPVLQALSAREATGRTILLPDGRQEPEFAFVHRCWQQILHIDIQTRRL